MHVASTPRCTADRPLSVGFAIGHEHDRRKRHGRARVDGVERARLNCRKSAFFSDAGAR